MRTTFKEVVGDLIADGDIPELLERLRNTRLPIVTVGDTTTLNFLTGEVIPDLAIIDLGTRRGRLAKEDRDSMGEFILRGNVTVISNPREQITGDLWECIKEFFRVFYGSSDPAHEGIHRDTMCGSIYGNELGRENAKNGTDGTSTSECNQMDATEEYCETEGYNKFKIGRPGRMGTTPHIIRIEGEEDLASLPCVYFAAKGGHVLYGLPDKGLIHIQVDQTHRTIVRDALIIMEAFDEPLDNQSN